MTISSFIFGLVEVAKIATVLTGQKKAFYCNIRPMLVFLGSFSKNSCTQNTENQSKNFFPSFFLSCALQSFFLSFMSVIIFLFSSLCMIISLSFFLGRYNLSFFLSFFFLSFMSIISFLSFFLSLYSFTSCQMECFCDSLSFLSLRLFSILSSALRICKLYPLQRSKTQPRQKSIPAYGTKLHLMVRLKFWRYLCMSYSRVHSDPEW